MEHITVESKAIVSVGYDDETRTLQLEFRSGAGAGSVYRYREVPRSVFEWLLRTPNKGVFVARQITGRYAFESVPVTPATPEAALEETLRRSLARPD
ncbi:MAG: KTSC domain-containing protein [Polyangiaceae bacterium]